MSRARIVQRAVAPASPKLLSLCRQTGRTRRGERRQSERAGGWTWWSAAPPVRACTGLKAGQRCSVPVGGRSPKTASLSGCIRVDRRDLPQPKSRNQRLPEPGWRQPGGGPAATAGQRERDGKMRARARGGSLLQIQLLKTREVGQDRGEGGGALRADIVRAVCMWREDKATREDGRETHKSR